MDLNEIMDVIYKVLSILPTIITAGMYTYKHYLGNDKYNAFNYVNSKMPLLESDKQTLFFVKIIIVCEIISTVIVWGKELISKIGVAYNVICIVLLLGIIIISIIGIILIICLHKMKMKFFHIAYRRCPICIVIILVIGKIIDVVLATNLIYQFNDDFLHITKFIYIMAIILPLIFVIAAVWKVLMSKICINKLANMRLKIKLKGKETYKYKLDNVELMLLLNGDIVVYNKKDGVHKFKRRKIRYLWCANQYFYFKNGKWRKTTIKCINY